MSSSSSSSSTTSPKFKAGPFLTAAKSFHGLKVDLISSGVQKSLRRRQVSDLGWFITEWLLFIEWDHTMSKAVLSNLSNRVNEVMMVEEVLACAQPSLVFQVNSCFQAWESSGRSMKAGRYIYAAVNLMSQARMIRLGSDIRAQFDTLDDDEQPLPLISDWVHMLEGSNQEEEVWRTYFRLSKVKGNETKMMKALLSRYKNTFLSLMAERYKKPRKERFLFMVHAVMAILYRGTFAGVVSPSSVYGSVMTESEWMEHVDRHKRGGVIPIPSYVVDMHTSDGRKAKKGRPEFAIEGSKVVDEDQEFYRDAWRKEYIRIKMLPPILTEKKKKKKRGREEEEEEEDLPKKKKKEKTEVSDLSSVCQPLTISSPEIQRLISSGCVGQRSTSPWKPLTYLTPCHAWKGPFFASKANTMGRLKLAMKRYGYFLELGVRVPRMALINEAENKDVWWLRMEQISQAPLSAWKVGKKENMCGGKSGSIVDRASLGIKLASQVTREEWRLHPMAIMEALLALSVRYVLDPMCGDSGLWNLLVRTTDWTVWCIDYEEERAGVCKNNQWTNPLSTRPWTEDNLSVLGSMRGRSDLKLRWKEITDILEKGDIPFQASRVEEIQVALLLS